MNTVTLIGIDPGKHCFHCMGRMRKVAWYFAKKSRVAN